MCAVSPCVDLASCSNGSGLARNFVYEWYFLRGLRNTLEKKVKLFPERYRVKAVPRVRSLREWHEAVTAPAGGYRNAAEYYQEASALRVAGQIRVPTLIVTAQDTRSSPSNRFSTPPLLETGASRWWRRNAAGTALLFRGAADASASGGIARRGVLCAALRDRDVRRGTLRIFRLAYPTNAHHNPRPAKSAQFFSREDHS